jgi:hypothetical protein
MVAGSERLEDGVMLPRLRRSGVVLGLEASQLVLVAAGLVVLVVANIGGGSAAILSSWWLWLPLLIFGAGSWRGRSFVDRVAVAGVAQLRRVLGKTSAGVDLDRGRQPRTESRLDVPGALGARMHLLELVGTDFGGGCMVWDAREGTATGVLLVSGSGWEALSYEERSAAAAGFGLACRGVTQLAGVQRVVTYARTIPRTSEYLRLGQESGSAYADREYEELLSGGALGNPPYRDVLVAVTLRQDAVRAEVKERGGGRLGLSRVLAERMRDLATDLTAAGAQVRGGQWMSAAAIRGACRLAFDPMAAVWLNPTDGLPADVIAATSVRERNGDHLELDSAVARTWWVEQWPNERVRAGFLALLSATGEFPHTVTQVWRPLDEKTSQKRLNNDKEALRTVGRLSHALGRDATGAQLAEEQALEARTQALTAGYTDVAYSAFVTAVTADTEGLNHVGRWLRQVAPGAVFNPLRGQQWASFAQAALPLGVSNRKR